MLNKPLFILAHQAQYPKFHSTYKNVVKNQWNSYDEQKKQQEKRLRYMISFAYWNVPYYHKLFDTLKLSPDDIRKVEDLEKLPILTKDTIRSNWEEFKPANLSSMSYNKQATGGSTGTPLKYRLLKEDRFLNAILLYRGWGYAGFELGDKMAFVAGASLDVGTKSIFNKKIHEITRNIRKLSSFDMSEEDMKQYTEVLNSFNPKIIRGYPSSLYFYAKWVQENDISVKLPDAVSTTSEKLMPHMRETISGVFDCEVFDAYGLNDGGVSAFECTEHNGLHIDTDRSIMEIVDNTGFQLDEGQGDIIATSLHNFAMPFIRYQTGDMGHIIEDKCSCGRESKLLKEVLGRSVDILITPEGKSVHGWFFLYIMWQHCHGIKEYQVIQKQLDKITIKLVIDEQFDDKQLEKIKTIVNEKSNSWILDFQFVDKIERTKAGKCKFIISEISK
jgi:phenylacetate-CoA ligase